MYGWLQRATRNPKLPFRRHFAVFAVISFFAVAQLAWWTKFQFDEGKRLAEIQNSHWVQQVKIAQEYQALHPEFFENWLAAAFPDLELRGDGGIGVRRAALSRLDEIAGERMRMFLAEGLFFGLLVLMGVLYMFRTLREEIDTEHRQSVFLTATSHELKTPITSLRMYLDTLRERELTPEKRQVMLATMSADLDRLNDLIERLLQAQRVLTPGTTLPLERIDISEETARAARELEHRVHFTGKHRLNVDTEYGLFAMADARRWQLVVKNLVDNAVKYSPQGGLVDIYLAKRDGRIELSVTDEGVGFAAEDSARLFERFFRSGREETRSAPGVGLGLYLVREIVTSFKGSVHAHSEGLGKGSRFTVELPSVLGGANE
jgi:signal transduction histidine kinase